MSIADECDELILDMSGSDADIFFTPDVREYVDSRSSGSDLTELKKKLLYIKDEFTFAVLLKGFLIGVLGMFKTTINKSGRDHDKIVQKLESNFYTKNKNFIDQLWYWVVYWNLWYCIQFLANIAAAFHFG